MVESILNANPTGYALIEAHVYDDYSDPLSETRFSVFYGSNWIPTMVADGLISYTDTDIDLWDDAVTTRRAITTDVTIRQWAVEVGSQTYDVTAEVCVEPGGTGKTMDAYMVQVLDHYPTTQVYYRNCLMQGVATQQITVASGTCETFTNTFTMDATSWAHQDDIKIIAWVQTPATLWPAEVHQADEMGWPFNAPPPMNDIFADSFESGDTVQWSAAVP